MSRTRRKGLNYFPLDTGFFGNKKIVNLSQRFGTKGIVLLINLYCEIYKGEGYYLVFDTDTLDYLCYQHRISEDELFSIVNYLNERSILTIVPLGESGATEMGLENMPLLITSHSVQSQYQTSLKSMKANQTVDPGIWLLSRDETEPNIHFGDAPLFPGVGPLNPDNLELAKQQPKEQEKEKKEKPKPKPKPEGKKEDSRRKTNNWEKVSDVKDKMQLGPFENVFLKGSELDKLKTEYPDDWEEIIETLSNYKESNGKGYKSDYAAIRSWVAKRVTQEKTAPGGKARKKPQPQISEERLQAMKEAEDSIFETFRKNSTNGQKK